MTRAWYASPVRIVPGDPVPGKWEPSFTDYVGPSPEVMEKLRGPFNKVMPAVEAARKWREDEGKRSEIYLVLAVDGVCYHCNLYDPERASAEIVRERFQDFFKEDAEPYKIKRRMTPEWSPYDVNQMIEIPLSQIPADPRFDLLQGYDYGQLQVEPDLVAFIMMDGFEDPVAVVSSDFDEQETPRSEAETPVPVMQILFTSRAGFSFLCPRNLDKTISVEYPRGFDTGMTSAFACAVAEFIGWHALEIRPSLTEGFAGYDTLKFKFKEEE